MSCFSTRKIANHTAKRRKPPLPLTDLTSLSHDVCDHHRRNSANVGPLHIRLSPSSHPHLRSCGNDGDLGAPFPDKTSFSTSPYLYRPTNMWSPSQSVSRRDLAFIHKAHCNAPGSDLRILGEEGENRVGEGQTWRKGKEFIHHTLLISFGGSYICSCPLGPPLHGLWPNAHTLAQGPHTCTLQFSYLNN